MARGRWAMGALICAALGWTACGGDSFTGGAGSGGNASGGSAGSDVNGGAAGIAGSAGSGTAGSGAAGGGNGGSAGMSGSGGSGGIPAEYAACDGPGQCLLVPSNCCGYCSQPELGDFLAINSDHESSFYGERCGGSIECPSCVTLMPGNFTALCRGPGRCQAVNVYDDDALVGCDAAEDCRLRWGAGCCEACAPTPDQLIAVKVNAVEQAQCGGGPCPGCPTAPYPNDASAACIDHKCSVVYAN